MTDLLVEEEVLKLHATYTATVGNEQKGVYRDSLFHYAADIIGRIATKKSEQWEVLATLDPGLILFSFQNHTRIHFARRGDRLTYRFRTNQVPRRTSPYSYRLLWVVQSPVFQDSITTAAPIIDKGSIYLTFNESQSMFHIRVCWTDSPYVPEGEVLIQSLVEYDVEGAKVTLAPSLQENESVDHVV